MKICTRCGIEKELSEFASRSERNGNPKSRCKTCTAEITLIRANIWREIDPDGYKAYQLEAIKKHRSKDPEAYKKYQSEYRRKYLYGITQAQVDEIGERQRWKCGGCGCDISSKPYVDHDHKTDQIRGLLCNRCNLGLGLLRDSSLILVGLISYLKNYQTEDTMEIDETIKDSLKPWIIPAIVGIVSALGGSVAGYIFGKRISKQKVAQLTEIVNALADYGVDQVERTETTITTIDLEVVEEEPRQPRRIISSAPPRPDPTDDDVEHQPHPSTVNPFARLEDSRDWDYEAERSTRTDTAPYIIHRDEFFNDEMGFDQSTWTYYQGDDILVDETDTPVYNYSENTGPLTFGHGSGDPSIVYIRNEDMKAEYEVVLNTGHYSVEVLGLELEEKLEAEDIKHSNVQKFRDRD